jgi:hypothetical protein
VYKEHAEPFFGVSAEDYAKMLLDEQSGITVNKIHKDYIFEIAAKTLKGGKQVFNVIKAHAAADKRARVDSKHVRSRSDVKLVTVEY